MKEIQICSDWAPKVQTVMLGKTQNVSAAQTVYKSRRFHLGHAESRLWPSDDDDGGDDNDDDGGDDDDNYGDLTCPYFSTRLPSSQTIPDLGWLTLTKAWAQIIK